MSTTPMVGYVVYDPTDQSVCYESMIVAPDTTGIDHEELKERAVLTFCTLMHIDPRQWATLQAEGYRAVPVDGVLNVQLPVYQEPADAPNYYASTDQTKNPLSDPLIYYYERRAPTNGQMDFAEQITRMAMQHETNEGRLAFALGVISAAYKAPLDLIRAYVPHPNRFDPLDAQYRRMYVQCAIVHNWCNMVEGLRPAATLYNVKLMEKKTDHE